MTKYLVSQDTYCYTALTQNFYEAMKACSSLRSIKMARKLHGQLISIGLDSSVFLQNHLLHLYSNCGSIHDSLRAFVGIKTRNVFSWNTMISALVDTGRVEEAEKLFDEMPERDSVSWTAIMSGYFHNDQPHKALRAFGSMVRSLGRVSDPFALSCAMKACGSLGTIESARQLHALVEKLDFDENMPIQSSLIDMYIKCDDVLSAERAFLRISNPSSFCWNSMIFGRSKLHSVERAFSTFTQMPERDNVSWATMISVFAQKGYRVQSLGLFVEMCDKGFRPNQMTYATVLSVCDLKWGCHLHARILRTEPKIEPFVGNGLVDMYSKCGKLRSSCIVLESLAEKSIVAWTSLMSGLAKLGLKEEALLLFNRMRRDFGVNLDEFVLATIIGVCSDTNLVSIGEQLHGFTTKAGMNSSVPIGNSLITMYSNCGDSDKAIHVFELMPVRDTISWTATIASYSQIRKVEKAREIFDKTPDRNVITWNSMICSYAQNGFWEEGLRLYKLMRRSRDLSPDLVTHVTAISACSEIAALKLGTQVISQAEKSGFGSNISVANSVITFYSKCGRIEEARRVFDSIRAKNLISWNAVLAGYAQNGLGTKVIETFEEMLNSGFFPDHISFVSVLSGCSHSGLVEKGKYYFNSMTEDFNITPTAEHFACMVDLLGRAGLLEEAKSLTKWSNFEPSASFWGALLVACRTHRDADSAELAVSRLVDLGAGDSGCYAILANLYSESGDFESFADVRKAMRVKGVQKNPGCSWIEVDNRVHVFTVNDTNHPRISEVYRALEGVFQVIEGARLYRGPVGFSSITELPH